MPQASEKLTPSEVIHRFIDEVKETKKLVRIVTSYDLESLTASAMLGKMLKHLEIPFEVLPDYERIPLTPDAKVIGINIPASECDECLILQTSTTESVSKVRYNVVLRYTSLLPGVLDLISEFTPVSKEMKALVLASILSKYLPRVKAPALNERDRNFLEVLSNDGVVEISKNLTLIGVSYLPPQTALLYSLDLFIPSKYLSENIENALSKVSKDFNIPSDKLREEVYLTKFDFFSKDIHMVTYMLLWLTDVKGFHGLLTSLFNNALLRYEYMRFLSDIKYLRDVVDLIINSRGQTIKNVKNIPVVNVEPTKASSNVLYRILSALNIINQNKGFLAFESFGKYYVPLSALNTSKRQSLIQKGAAVVGGYLELSDLSEVSSKSST
ncbi:MAG: hypothetical protein B7O98_03455 [Zestosphaera tikiterensis]|uniref:Phosphoesterase n=1 Tax=Zestosphaera tikiterensis TaxID=1973259 RepID=A0A2R7Y7P4_9CREN|nr:MAG: hypothetical protein B7O98_03455 [Zestosphaera tikiterensis]